MQIEYHNPIVGPGWLRYKTNDSIWNLDDGECIAIRARDCIPISAPALDMSALLELQMSLGFAQILASHILIRIANGRFGLHHIRLETNIRARRYT